QLLFVEIDDGDRAGAVVRDGLEHQEPDRTCPVDRPLPPHREAKDRQPVDDAGDRLDESRELVGHLPDWVDVGGRSDDVLGEASVARHADRVPVQAVVSLAPLAEEARAAEERRVDGDAIPFAQRRLDGLRPDCRDLARELMAADERIRREEVPFEDVLVGAADPTGGDADDDLVRAGLGVRRVAYVELASRLVVRGLHFTAPKVRPRTSERWASQPARITGATASVEAADIFAQNSPSLVMKLEMKTGNVPEFALVRFTASRNSFQLKISDRSTVAARPGAVSGRTIRVMILRKPAPSTTAASRISFGRSAKKERIIQITSGRLNAAYRRIIPRRLSNRPTRL